MKTGKMNNTKEPAGGYDTVSDHTHRSSKHLLDTHADNLFIIHLLHTRTHMCQYISHDNRMGTLERGDTRAANLSNGKLLAHKLLDNLTLK